MDDGRSWIAMDDNDENLNDMEDLFTHLVFWTSEQHVGFLVKVHTLMRKPRDKSGNKKTRLDGLDDLASFLEEEYKKEKKHWGTD